MSIADQSLVSIELHSGFINRIALNYQQPVLISLQEAPAIEGEPHATQAKLKVNYPHLDTEQELRWPKGSRKLRIRHLTGDILRPDRTIITLEFNCVEPHVWTFIAAETCEKEGADACFLRAAQIKISIKPTEITSSVDVTGTNKHAYISAHVPAGSSQLVLELDHYGASPISPIAIIAAPHQIAETSIALSVVGGSNYTPIFEFHPAPMSRAEFLQTIAVYHDLIKEQTALQTRTLLGHDPDPHALIVGLRTQREHQAKLSTYRGWLKRNRLFGDLLLRNRIQKVLVLAVAALDSFYVSEDPEENPSPHSLATVLVGHSDLAATTPESCGPVIRIDPGAPEKDPAQDCARLQAFARSVQEILGQGEPQYLEVPWGPPENIYVGLHQALLGGRIVSCIPSAEMKETNHVLLPYTHSHTDKPSAEVVLIDGSNRLSHLTAVSYATAAGCDLAIVPEASDANVTYEYLATIDSLLTTGHSRETANRGGLRFAAKLFGLFKHVWRHLNDNKVDRLLSQITQATNTLIPDNVADYIGDRPVTAFGLNSPLHFYKSNGWDWRQKPIGLVPADADIAILVEMTSRGSQQSRGIFSLFLDSGYFVNSETEFVSSLLSNAYSAPIVIGPDFASEAGLLIPVLGPEMIFFNTHGFDGGIVIGTHPMPSYQIANWWTFRSAPIIFNNSCLSWKHISGEFVRAGARGYIGTLWSVETESAARIAEQFSHLCLSGSEGIAAALAKSRTQDVTGHSYVFAGVVAAAFSRTQASLERQYVSSVLAGLEFISGMFSDGRGISIGLIYRQFKVVEQALVDACSIRSEAWRYDVAMSVLCRRIMFLVRHRSIFSGGGFVSAGRFDFRSEIVDSQKQLAALARRHSEAARLREFSIEAQSMHAEASVAIRLQLGDMHQAIEWQQEVVRLKKGEGDLAIAEQCELARLHIYVAEPQKALDILSGLEFPSNGRDQPETATLHIGNMVQSLLRVGRVDEALALCEKGLDISREHSLSGRRRALTADKVNLLNVKGETREARDLCASAIKEAYEEGDADGALILEAQMGQILMHLGELDQALEIAERALKSAHARNDRLRHAALLMDLCFIHSRRGEHEKALLSALSGGAGFLESGHTERLVGAGQIIVLCAKEAQRLDVVFSAVAHSLALACAAELDPAWLLEPISALVVETCNVCVDNGDRGVACEFVDALRSGWKGGSGTGVTRAVLVRWLDDLSACLQGRPREVAASDYAGYEYLMGVLREVKLEG